MKDVTYQRELALHEAILFATKKHKGQKRKGTDFDYICHPLEVLSLLIAASPQNIDLQIAGVLHDTVEDTGATISEIHAGFGDKVASYVAFVSEDKSKSWRERKEHTVASLAAAGKDCRILVCADKLANLRDMCVERRNLGDAIWERFNAGKEDIRWYYQATLTALRDLSLSVPTADLFGEAKVRYEELFGPLFEKIWY